MARITISKLSDLSGMRFDADTASGHTVTLDAKADVGGKDQGPRPAELPFVGLAACTGMDVISILRKMRQSVDRFEVEVEGLRRTDEHPKYWNEIRVIFHVDGEVEAAKLNKAIELSSTRYCGVSAIMKGKVTIQYRFILNGETTEMEIAEA